MEISESPVEDPQRLRGSDFLRERKDEKKSAFPTELTQAPSQVDLLDL